ncbi:MAG TPA: hypothetical protein VMS56_08215 [Thermoanaerobaculia bacterium]|nr:hypothetical protein [Thermoanaerobaculia bacterium]
MKAIRTFTLGLAALILVAGSLAAQVQVADRENVKAWITLDTVGTLQALEQKNAFNPAGNEYGELAPGFQTAFGNFGMIGKFGRNEEIELVFNMYLSSRNHPSSTYGNEGYIILHGLPGDQPALFDRIFEKVDVKVGHFLLGYGDHHLRRTNNAAAQSNPLIGNFVIDPELVTIGGEIWSKPGRFNWLVGLSNGTTTEDFAEGRGTAYHAKLWAYPIEPLRTSISFFRADHSDNPPKANGGSHAQLFSGNRSGERYAAVWGGGQAPGQILPRGGKDLTAYQFDATWKDERPLELYASWGLTEDSDINGTMPGTLPEEWAYWAGDVVWRFNPRIYAAARYSGAQAKMLAGTASDGEVARLQVGGGYRLTENMLIKLEYVTQKLDGFVQGDVISNTQAWRQPEFSGPVMEVSFSF